MPLPTDPRRGQRRAHRVPRLPTPSRLLLLVAGGSLLLLLFVAWQGFTARSALLDAQRAASQLQGQVTDGQLEQARRTADELRADTERARDRTDGVVWSALGHLPWVGNTFQAVSATSAALDRVADKSLPPALDLTRTLSGLRIEDGAVPLQPIARHAAAMGSAARAAAAADTRVAAIDPDSVLGPARDTFTSAQRELREVHAAVQAAATAVRLLPDMLGADGPRRYLLVVQNNAESRSTGGIFGSWAVLETSKGTISLGAQGSAGDVPRLQHPVIPLQPQEEALYGDDLGTLFQDLNFTPDFPRSARMAAAMFERRPTSDHLDGVVSVDPVVLSYLLEAVGPVDVQLGDVLQKRLTADNAVHVLLNEIYRTQPPEVQDAFFAVAAREVFERVTSGAGDPVALVRALARGAGEGRVLIWSRDGREERTLIDTRVGGDLPHDHDGAPQVGVYLNDATASKMEYYLDLETKLRAESCTTKGVQTLALATSLTSKAPLDAATLPPSVVGPGTHAPPGTMRLNLRLYAPVDGKITSLSVNGKDYTIAGGTHDGRPVAVVPVSLEPGETVRISAGLRSGPGQEGDPVLSTTPTVEKQPTRWDVQSACG